MAVVTTALSADGRRSAAVVVVTRPDWHRAGRPIRCQYCILMSMKLRLSGYDIVFPAIATERT